MLLQQVAASRNESDALAGIAPYNRDSGMHQGRRTIRGDWVKVRRVLHKPKRCS